MVTTLIICVPITALVVGFLVLKSVQLGLRWQVETKQEQAPTMEIPNPITPIMEAKQQREYVKQEAKISSVYNEWVNGAEEER